MGRVGRAVDQAFGSVIQALTREPSATALLSKQHDEVKAMFEKLERAPTYAKGRALFEEVAANLVAHDAIEREIFYPACEKAMGMTDLLGEALAEHGVIEFCLYEADRAKKNDFAFKSTVLSEMVKHHVKEEENEFFPRAEKALGKARLQKLAAEMTARFEEAKAGDFRAAVYDNLKKVLAGELKPAKSRRPASRTKTAKAKKRRRS
jgi:hemerythrin-like domain-containing protein